MAPDTLCPHWMGIFCEFDIPECTVDEYVEAMNEIDQYVKEHPEVLERVAEKFADQLADVRGIALGDKETWREEK